MARIVMTLVAAVLVAAACGDAADPVATTPPATGPPGGAAPVALTGTVSTGPDGLPEICVAGTSQDCFGVAIDGDLPGDLAAGAVVRLTGTYDGRTITLTEPSREVAPGGFGPPDFSTPCNGLEGRGGDPAEAIQSYTASVPDSFAGLWFDQGTGVYTVWFTDADPSAHEAALAAATGGAPVCVIGGALHTEAELRAAQDAAFAAFREVASLHSAHTDVLRNVVVVEAEHVDREILDAALELSPAIEMRAFFEVLDGTVADLPEPIPVRPGDVALRTAETRAIGGMDALGSFVLGFDEDLRCFYFDWPDGGRVLPVWPLGYSGDSGPPPTVYDWDGEPFATAGDQLDIGGGGGAVPAAGPEGCGATETWVVNPS